MTLGELGAILLVLTVVVLLGNLWFHLVEGLLDRVKRLFTRHRDPPAWHPLEPEQKDDEDAG